jgi:SAM-dependent methyltransferase
MGSDMNEVINTDFPHLGGNIRGGDVYTWCPAVWDYLIYSFQPESLLDIGCGEGYLIEYFKKRGVRVAGIDGLPENRDNAPASVRDDIYINDYTKGRYIETYFDMVISCEFVEHIEQKYEMNYLSQFINCRVLVFTHALPGQGGYHHVNCQSSRYWKDRLTGLGMTYHDEHTRNCRLLGKKKLWLSTLVFINC